VPILAITCGGVVAVEIPVFVEIAVVGAVASAGAAPLLVRSTELSAV
jgi:hypothetical protein